MILDTLESIETIVSKFLEPLSLLMSNIFNSGHYKIINKFWLKLDDGLNTS